MPFCLSHKSGGQSQKASISIDLRDDDEHKMFHLQQQINEHRVQLAEKQALYDQQHLECQQLVVQKNKLETDYVELQKELQLVESNQVPNLQQQAQNGAHHITLLLSELVLANAEWERAKTIVAEQNQQIKDDKKKFIEYIMAQVVDQESNKALRATRTLQQQQHAAEASTLAIQREKLGNALDKRRLKLDPSLAIGLSNEYNALVEQMKATSKKHKESSRRLNSSEQQRNTAINENDGLHRLQCDLQQRTKQLKIDLKRVRRAKKKAARSKRVKKSTGKDEIEFISSDDDDDFL